MNFALALDFVLAHEGGYVNDPQDPGGETKYGISKRAYPSLDIANLTREDAAKIYRSDYWDKCRCGELPPGTDLLTFDAAVNQGPRAAIQMLQDALNVKVDGIIGPITLRAAQTVGMDLVPELAAIRMHAYALNPSFHRYGLGWSRRLIGCVVAALKG